MTYKYTSPLDRGYKKFKLTKKQHNEIFLKRKIRWFDKYEYYYDDKGVVLHRFYNWKVVTLSTLLFPVTAFLEGLMNFKELWRDLTKLYNQKETGSFVSDYVSYKHSKYEQIINLIEKGD